MQVHTFDSAVGGDLQLEEPEHPHSPFIFASGMCLGGLVGRFEFGILEVKWIEAFYS
jgi:hypothetical protein